MTKLTEKTAIRRGMVLEWRDNFLGCAIFGTVVGFKSQWDGDIHKTSSKPAKIIVIATLPACFEITDRRHLMAAKAVVMTQKDLLESVNDIVRKYASLYQSIMLKPEIAKAIGLKWRRNVS